MAEKIPLEKVIVNDIMKWLKSAGYAFVYKTHGSAYAPSGLPDLVVIDKHGRFVGLEVKRPKVGRLTDLQRRVLDQIRAAGGYSAVVCSIQDAQIAMASSEGGSAND